MKVDGGCHCGRITYEAEIDPEKVLICHCTDCQSLSGCAFRTVVRVPENAFKLLSGEPKRYVKQADSGNKLVMAFCGDCGSPIYGAHTGDHPPFYGIRVGTIRQRGCTDAEAADLVALGARLDRKPRRDRQNRETRLRALTPPAARWCTSPAPAQSSIRSTRCLRRA